MSVLQPRNKLLKIFEGWSMIYFGELADGLVLLRASCRGSGSSRDG